MKTSRTAGLIVGMVAGAAALLPPGATADGLPAERAASQALAATGVSPIDLILDQPVIALLVVLALGLLVGQIKIRGVMLGMVGIFLVGMPVGYLGFQPPPMVSTLGAIFLLYGVGLGAGPTFFRSFGTYGKPLLLVLSAMVAAAALATLVFVVLAGIPADLAAGVFAGAMKSSSGFASALDQLPDRGHVIAVGYGLTYPLSLFLIVLVVQVAPTLLRQDVAALNVQIAAGHPSRPPTASAMVEVLNPAVAGKPLREITLVADLGCRVVRVLDGDRLRPVPFEWPAQQGSHVLVLGPADALPTIAGYLGRPSDHRGLLDVDDHQADIVLTSPQMIGRTLGEVNPLVHYGVQVREVSRQGHDLMSRADLVLQALDVLQVTGLPDNIKQFARDAGDRAKALQQTDMLSLALGIAAGVILGAVPIGWPGAQFQLGMAGGPLVVALVVSHFGRIGWIAGHFPPAVQLFLVKLGLSLLLADASVKAGGELANVFGRHGPALMLMSVVVSLAPLAAGLLVSAWWVRHNLLQTLAVLCGGLNATPAYDLLSRKADADEVLVMFTTAYAIAMILTVIATQVLIGVMRGL
jgi:putative transport protein